MFNGVYVSGHTRNGKRYKTVQIALWYIFSSDQKNTFHSICIRLCALAYIGRSALESDIQSIHLHLTLPKHISHSHHTELFTLNNFQFAINAK